MDFQYVLIIIIIYIFKTAKVRWARAILMSYFIRRKYCTDFAGISLFFKSYTTISVNSETRRRRLIRRRNEQPQRYSQLYVNSIFRRFKTIYYYNMNILQSKNRILVRLPIYIFTS